MSSFHQLVVLALINEPLEELRVHIRYSSILIRILRNRTPLGSFRFPSTQGTHYFIQVFLCLVLLQVFFLELEGLRVCLRVAAEFVWVWRFQLQKAVDQFRGQRSLNLNNRQGFHRLIPNPPSSRSSRLQNVSGDIAAEESVLVIRTGLGPSGDGTSMGTSHPIATTYAFILFISPSIVSFKKNNLIFSTTYYRPVFLYELH